MQTTPSRQMLHHLVDELARHVPFSQMQREHVERFAAAATEAYYAPGEVVLEPASGPVQRLLYVRRGAVQGTRGVAEASGGVQYEAGELFPVSAVVGQRAVSSRYAATDDLFCLEVDATVVRELAAASPPFADFLGRRVQHFLELSQRALRQSQAQAALDEQAMERPLADLPRKALISCTAQEPLIDVLRRMHAARVGSVLALDDQGAALGILTRHDVLERVALARPADGTPVIELMSQPVLTLEAAATVQDAALAMSRHGVRHLPITEAGRVVNVVSERDLFALQKLSLRQLGTALRAAPDGAALVQGGADIRRFAAQLVAQGLSARSLTQLLSHLNDLLTARMVELVAQRHGLPLQRACWLAFGSEGRAEQTIATDQDNGLVFDSDEPAADRPRWLAMAQEVNHGLAEAGYPLCQGGVMAGNAPCCLTQQEWLERFETWVRRSAPEDILAAAIFFDLRPLAGQLALARPLRERMLDLVADAPRFMRQLAEGALRWRLPLSWRGALDPRSDGDQKWIDLKTQGTAVFVDAGRLFTLAQHVGATGTRERLLHSAAAMNVGEREAEGWVSAFEVLQMFRLRLQIEGASAEHPNRVDVSGLNSIDRRVLKEALRVARALQQRIELDYLR